MTHIHPTEYYATVQTNEKLHMMTFLEKSTTMHYRADTVNSKNMLTMIPFM